MSPRLPGLAVTAAALTIACNNPQGVATEALELRGLEDIHLGAADANGSFGFEGKRGDEDCSGTVVVQPHDDPGTADITLECLPPAGAWTSSLPPTASPTTVALARRCDGGVADACTALAHRFRSGDELARDLARANMLFNQACASQDGEGCYQVAVSMQTAGSSRASEADTLLIDACDYGWAKACGEAAHKLYNADVQEQLPTMARMARKGCDADETQACLVLGVALAYGMGMPLDMEQARKRLMQACSGGLDKACTLVESL